jgi:hypothetical protein
MRLHLLPLLACVAAAPAAQAETPDVVGQVAATHGSAVAERDGHAPRPLACGDPVHQGERIVTADGSRVGVLLGDVLAQLGGNSRVAVGRTAQDTADLELERGELRVIDPREGGPSARLAVLGNEARIAGNDAEAYVFAEKTGRYAMLCEWDAPLEVARGGAVLTAGPGACVISKSREPLYTARAHDKRIAAPGADRCDFGPVVAALDLFTPFDVAAGPPGVGPELPAVFGGFVRSACDNPGSGCAAVAEAPPGGGGFPGGGGQLPGGGNQVFEPPAGGGIPGGGGGQLP